MLAAAVLAPSGDWLADLYPADDLDTPTLDVDLLREQICRSVEIQAMFRGAGWIITPVPESL